MAFTKEKSHLVITDDQIHHTPGHVLRHGTKFSVSSIEEQGIGLVAKLEMIGGRLLSWADRKMNLSLRPGLAFGYRVGKQA